MEIFNNKLPKPWIPLIRYRQIIITHGLMILNEKYLCESIGDNFFLKKDHGILQVTSKWIFEFGFSRSFNIGSNNINHII